MGHYVYKYVNNNEIIYIGKNDTNLIDRIKAHCNPHDELSKYLNAKIYYIELPSALECDIVESVLINKYNPSLNKAKKIQEQMEVIYNDEHKWKLYNEKDFQIEDTEKFLNHKKRSYNARKGNIKTKIKNLKLNILNFKANKLLFESVQQKFYTGDYTFEKKNENQNVKFSLTNMDTVLYIWKNFNSFIPYNGRNIVSLIEFRMDINQLFVYMDIMENYNSQENSDLLIRDKKGRLKDISLITLKDVIQMTVEKCKNEITELENEIQALENELIELEQEYKQEQ